MTIPGRDDAEALVRNLTSALYEVIATITGQEVSLFDSPFAPNSDLVATLGDLAVYAWEGEWSDCQRRLNSDPLSPVIAD